jgi:hypothetical protein
MGASNSVVECQLPKLKVVGSNPISRSSFLRSHPPRLTLHSYRFVCLVVALLSFTACKPDPLDKALRGELPPDESNLNIVGYCQSCHIHRAINPSEHLTYIRTLYDRVPYTTTTQCRACHLVSEDTWSRKHRKTIFPSDVAQNHYVVHERRLLKEHPDLSTGAK